jgi:hypothetical protein
MASVWYDYVEADGSINRLIPRSDFAHAETTASDSKRNPLTSEIDEAALAKWILGRKARGLSGGVRLKSTINQRNGLYSIDKVEVR